MQTYISQCERFDTWHAYEKDYLNFFVMETARYLSRYPFFKKKKKIIPRIHLRRACEDRTTTVHQHLLKMLKGIANNVCLLSGPVLSRPQDSICVGFAMFLKCVFNKTHGLIQPPIII